MADTFLTGFGQGPVQAGTQLNDLHEVVEVSGLERGVLTIVDEGEQFAGLSDREPSGTALRARTTVPEIKEVAEDLPSWLRDASWVKSLEPRLVS